MWPSRLVLAASAALLVACGGDRLDRLADGGQGRAVEALSGEVLRLEDGRRVRLAGIDAPTPAAEAALERWAAGRRVALLHGGERTDAYGRALAHVRVLEGRRWLQGELLDAGLARVRTTPGEAALAREMLAREARARARRRGLWAESAYGVRLPAEAEPGGFQIVEGRVRRAERVRDSAYLDFEAGRHGFSVRIPRRALRDFGAAGLPLESLRGRLVRVRGAVGASRFGPVMQVDHPEQIELLRERR